MEGNSNLFIRVIFSCLLLNFAYAEAARAAPSPIRYSYVSEDVWELVDPYLMPKNHPLKAKLDKLFSKKRVLASRKSLVAAGFEDKRPEPQTKVIVTRHPSFKGYIFKIYTDDRLSYYRDEPEYITWMLRARGAKLVREEIKQQGWQDVFKAPRKWIYPLPRTPGAAPGHLQKNFILVEEEMDILSHAKIKEKWRDGTMTTDHLDKLFFLLKKLGLRGGCKFDNIPICKDGRIAFIDTQNNLRWPVPYERLFPVLEEPLSSHWGELIKKSGS